MRDWAANYDGEGQEHVAREGRDSRVAMMAAAVNHGGGGQRWRQWVTTTMTDDNSGG